MNYADKMKEWSIKFGDMITWKTKPGDPVNHMFKLLGISRASHVAYLKDNSLVPAYINKQIEMFESMPEHDKTMFAMTELFTQDITLEQASEALVKAWTDLVERDPFVDETYSQIVGRFNVRSANDKIRNIYKIGGHGLHIILLIKNYVDEYVGDFEFSLKEVLNKDNKKLNRVASNYTKIKFILDVFHIRKCIEQFDEACRSAIRFYSPNASEQSIDDAVYYGFEIVMAARRDFESYKKYQVSLGGYSSDMEYKLRDQIYVFDSVEDLIEGSVNLPNGFSLSLIKKARIPDSYFCIAVKQNGTLNIITDYVKYSNPFEEERMASRNQNYNMIRFESSYMPYEMLKLVFERNTKVIDSSSTDLTVIDGGIRVLGHVSSFKADTALWFHFMMQEAKLFFESKDALALPNLSYISKTDIQHPLSLLHNGQQEAKQLPIEYRVNTGIVKRTAKDLDRDMLSKTTIVEKVSVNQWMEDMFNDLIEEDHLYIPSDVATDEKDVLCLQDLSTSKSTSLSVINTGGMGYFDEKRITDSKISLKKMDLSVIGSKEEIQEYCDYVARANKVIVLNELAKKHYEENKAEIKEWIYKAIKKNLPSIVDDLVTLNHQRFFIVQHAPELISQGLALRKSGMTRQIYHKWLTSEERNVRYYKKGKEVIIDHRSMLCKTLNLMSASDYSPKCYLNRTEDAEHRFYVQIDNIYDLMNITGMKREKFPPFLRYWGLVSTDVSNDPLSKYTNPWTSMEITFSLPLSREAVSERRKAHGLPARLPTCTPYFMSDVARKEFLDQYADCDEYKIFNESGATRTFRDSVKEDMFNYKIN